MGLSKIPANQPQQNLPQQTGKTQAAVLLTIQGKEVTVQFDRVKKVARGMAKVAFLLGETNNEEEYAEEVAEDVYEALKLYGKRKNKKKRYK